MANPEWTEPESWSGHSWSAGDVVLWPNGTEGKVCGVDFDGGTLLDECGAWHGMFDVDLLEQAA